MQKICTFLLLSLCIFSARCHRAITNNEKTLNLESTQGVWSSNCDSKQRAILTFSNSTLVLEAIYYSDSNCVNEMYRFRMESGVTIGESVVSPSGANALDLLVQSFIAIPKDVAAANQLNTDSFCGYTGWTANTPRSVAGAHCGGTTVPNLPSLNSTWYSVVRIDFSRNPEALYIGASTSSNDGSTPDKRHPKYSAAAFKN